MSPSDNSTDSHRSVGEEDRDPKAKPEDITILLDAWSAGSPEALDDLIPRVLDEVRVLARRHLARESAHSLQTTELVNEVYLRLAGLRKTSWASRAQFFKYLGDLVRRVLVDRARRRLSAKRGGGTYQIPLDEKIELAEMSPENLVALDDVLDQLPPRQRQIVEYRVFVGLSHQEIAEVLGLGRRTVIREWRKARMWLRHALDKSED
jgi:RNA polymerase sigma factor (TIGR02999 family)